MILYQKLYDIDKNGHKSISKSLKPAFKFKKRNREELVKNEIKSLAQENLFILKKILTKNSEYSAKKYEQQYKQSQKYKKMLCHYNCIDFSTSKSNNEPIVQSCNFCSTKKTNQKLPKLFTPKSSQKCFRTTISRGGALDERYYKEATRSRKMSSTTRSKFRNTRYDDKNKKKEASNIDEESNEGSSSDKKISGNDNDNSENGSASGSGGSGEGSELNKSKSGSEEGSGNGSGEGSEN